MPNPWTMKMEMFTAFSDEERRRLDNLTSVKRLKHAPREDIISDGAHSADCHVVLSGLACRYKILRDGRRQIMAFLIPGDLCDAEIFILKVMDHGVAAMTPTTTALVSGAAMKAMLRETSGLGEALWWGTMTDLGVLRERIIDHGRRNAKERIAHLLFEMLVRYRMVELAPDDTFDFPITQADLADATGLTPVHAKPHASEASGRRADRDSGAVDQGRQSRGPQEGRPIRRRLSASRPRARSHDRRRAGWEFNIIQVIIAAARSN